MIISFITTEVYNTLLKGVSGTVVLLKYNTSGALLTSPLMDSRSNTDSETTQTVKTRMKVLLSEELSS